MASVAKREWTYKGEKKTAWIIRYLEGGKHRQKTFEKKKDADAFKQKVERELHEGTHVVDANALTITDVCREFMILQEARHDDGRIGLNRYSRLEMVVRVRIKPHLGSIRLADLTTQRVEQFYSDMRTQGYSIRTAKDTIYELRLVEVLGRKRGYTKKEPVLEALKDLRGTTGSVVRTFDKDEVAHLLSIVATKGLNFKARSSAMINCIVNVAAFCGLRYGEIMALNLDSIDFDKRLIRVRQSLLFNDTLKGPKTKAGIRDVPMAKRVSVLLSDWIRLHYVENDRGLLFRTPKGTIVSQANFHRQWVYLMERAGLNDGETFHFHALRHFCASWMIENGLPVTDVATLMGHSKFDMTLQVYAHPVMKPSTRIDVIEQMADALPAQASAMIDARIAQRRIS